MILSERACECLVQFELRNSACCFEIADTAADFGMCPEDAYDLFPFFTICASQGQWMIGSTSRQRATGSAINHPWGQT